MSKTYHMIVKIAMALMLTSVMIGCCTTDDEYQDLPENDMMIQSAGFNQEQYIWQMFLFPTNRTSGRQ